MALVFNKWRDKKHFYTFGKSVAKPLLLYYFGGRHSNLQLCFCHTFSEKV